MGPLEKTNTLQNILFFFWSERNPNWNKKWKFLIFFITANFAIIYLYLIPTKPDIADRIVSGLFVIILPFNAHKNQTESKMPHFKLKTIRSERRRTVSSSRFKKLKIWNSETHFYILSNILKMSQLNCEPAQESHFKYSNI